MSLLKQANQAMIAGRYSSALKLYEQARNITPVLSKIIDINIQICKQKIGLDYEFTNSVMKTVLRKQDDFPILIEAKKNSKSDELWDTTKCVSMTNSSKNLAVPNKLFIVPAILKPRNTTRYRAYNLLEICKNVTDVELVDYKNPNPNFFESLFKENTIVIIQRMPFLSKVEENFLNNLRSTPALIVYEIDDQIFDETELDGWRINELICHPSKYYKAMQYADQYIVSTKELRRKVEILFNKPTHIVQNVLNEKLIEISSKVILEKGECREFSIGYASGSNTHDKDLDVALVGLSRFLDKYDEVKFYCIGDVNLPHDFQNKHKDKIQFLPKVNWEELPSVLAKFDVQIIPLEDTSFNNYKSHIRYLESSAVEVPVVASNCGEQALSIVNGYTGLLCDNSDDAWFQAIEWYYNNPDLRKSIGKMASEVVTKYWTTASPFRLGKIKEVLRDFSLTIMRDKLSIILVVYNPIDDVKAIFESIFEMTHVPYELLIWINSSSNDVREYINSIERENCFVIDVGVNVGKAVAANYLFKIAAERFIVGFDDDYIVPQYWAEKMITAAKAVPKLGWLSTNLTPDSSGLRGLGKASSYSGVCIYLPSGVGGWVVFSTASSREKIGYYKEHGLYGGVDGDFNRRARSLGLTTGYVRSVVGRHKILRQNSLAWELFKQRIQDNMRIHGKDSDLIGDKFVDFFSERSQNLSCRIKISTPISHDENVWGDTHYAKGLKNALRKLDYDVHIDKHEEWYEGHESPDVVIHLFGLHEYKPNPYSLNILWIISHVDKIHKQQLEKYDYIFCSSNLVLDLVRNLVPEIESRLLLQCTDETVFFPNHTIVKDIDVLFVGNSRRVYRDSVRYAIEGGFDVHVYGTKWEQFISSKYIRAQSLNSDEVASLYRRAKVVLNDHWADQLKYGLVNNRVFDALACGAMVLSDDNQGIKEIFGREVPIFTNATDFSKGVHELLNNNVNNFNEFEGIAKSILTNHTFTKRASEIHDAVVFLIQNYVSYKSEFLHKLRSR